MPTESVRISELNGKRNVKNKVPKRLRRKNKPIVSNNEENLSTSNIQFIFDKLSEIRFSSSSDHTPLTKEKIIIQESDPHPLNTSSSNTDQNPTVTSINDTSV